MICPYLRVIFYGITDIFEMLILERRYTIGSKESKMCVALFDVQYNL